MYTTRERIAYRSEDRMIYLRSLEDARQRWYIRPGRTGGLSRSPIDSSSCDKESENNIWTVLKAARFKLGLCPKATATGVQVHISQLMYGLYVRSKIEKTK